MPSVTIPLSIAAALPIVGQMLSSVLTDDRQKPGINALIAAFFLIAAAVGCALLAGNFTGNWTVDAAIIIAYCALLMRGSFGILMQFFELTPSPIANALFGKQAMPPVAAALQRPTPISQRTVPGGTPSNPIQPGG